MRWDTRIQGTASLTDAVLLMAADGGSTQSAATLYAGGESRLAAGLRAQTVRLANDRGIISGGEA